MKRYVFIFGILLFWGFGCGRSGAAVTQKTQLDSSSHVYGALPAGWGSTRLNTLYKVSGSASGLGYVSGGVTTGFGPQDDTGGILVQEQIIAVPKGFVSTFEKSIYPVGATRAFEAGTFEIYTAGVGVPDDTAKNFVSSLEYRP